MKYIITENKIANIALHWMNSNFKPEKLEIVKSKEQPKSIFFKKNGKVVMEIDESTGKDFWFDDEAIWLFFESVLGMKHEEIQDILRYWLEEFLKVKGYRPMKKRKFWGLNFD